MSLDLSDMRELLRQGLGGLDSQDLPDAEADRLLNMALWSIEDRFDFQTKETMASGTLVSGTETVSLPSDLDAITSVAVQEDQGNRWQKLDRTTQDFLDDHQDPDAESEAFPEKYLRRDAEIILYPTPDKAYSYRIALREAVASLAAAGDTPDLPRNWHEIVVEEAVVRGHFYHQDYNLAQMAANFSVGHQRSAVLSQNKEEEDSRRSGLEVESEGRRNWR